MIEILDFKNIQTYSNDRRDLQSLLRQLLAQPFLFFRVSYGEELTVHLGEPREHPHPRLKNRRKGSYIIAARASSWYFRPNTQPTMFVGVDDPTPDGSSHTERLDIKEIESRPLVEAGSVVAQVDVLPAPDGFGLLLVLSDQSTLIIMPTPAHDEGDDDDVADWEVFTPHDRYLRVGPGQRWAYLESGKPETRSAEPSLTP